MAFPCLMESRANGDVVMFTDYQSGTVMKTTRQGEVGAHSKKWINATSDVWRPFRGKLILEND